MQDDPVTNLEPKDDILTHPKLINLMKEIQMITNLKDVENTVNFLTGLVGITNVIHEVTAEDSLGGKSITLIEYAKFIPCAIKLPGMISAIPEIPNEVGDQITPEELAEIQAVLKDSEYLQDNANLLDATNDALAIGNNIKEFIEKYFGKK
jgi:hypothetical protein